MNTMLIEVLVSGIQLLVSMGFLLSIFLTGYGVLKLITNNQAWYVSLVLSFSLGLASLFCSLDAAVHFFGRGGYLIIIIFFLYSMFVVFRHWEELNFLIHSTFSSIFSHKTLLFISLFVCITMWLGIARSGLTTSQGMVFQPGIMRDSLWHLALTKSLLTSNPPAHPSDPTQVLQNYHYFYDLFIAAWHTATTLPIQSIYFQIASLVTTLLLAFSSVVVLKKLITTKFDFFASILLIFLFWGGSFAFLIPLFLPNLPWGESSFWVSQTFVMLVNPQLLLSFFMLNALVLLGLLGISQRFLGASLFYWLCGIAIFLYAIAGLKFFGVLFGFILIGLLLFWYAYKSSNRKYLFLIFGSTLIVASLLISLRFVNIHSKQMQFAPLWFVSSMIASPDRVYIPDWVLREEHYRAVGSWHHLLILKTVETLLFIVGNLGVRVLGVLFIVPVLIFTKRTKETLQNRGLLWLFLVLAIISAVIPLLFIQNGIVWNSIQFWYYTLFFVDYLAAIAFGLLCLLIKSRFFAGISFLVILGASSILFGIHFVQQNTQSELIATNYFLLDRYVSKKDRIFVCPRGESSSLLFQTSFLSMFTDAKPVFIDPLMLEVIGKSGYQRTSDLENDLQRRSFDQLYFSEATPYTAILCDTDQIKNRHIVISHNNIKLGQLTLIKIQPFCINKNSCQEI